MPEEPVPDMTENGSPADSCEACREEQSQGRLVHLELHVVLATSLRLGKPPIHHIYRYTLRHSYANHTLVQRIPTNYLIALVGTFVDTVALHLLEKSDDAGEIVIIPTLHKPCGRRPLTIVCQSDSIALIII